MVNIKSHLKKKIIFNLKLYVFASEGNQDVKKENLEVAPTQNGNKYIFIQSIDSWLFLKM
jgi:hypothetical protein